MGWGVSVCGGAGRRCCLGPPPPPALLQPPRRPTHRLSLPPPAPTPLPAGFLGVLGGTFDPSLMCVMGAALLVALPGFQLALRRARPLCASCFELPRKTAVEANLIVGALTFGAGWGEC